MNAATEASKFVMPDLKDGEIYAGAIINPDGTGHHIILLDGDNDDADWERSDAAHARLLQTEDMKEGLAAFFERRPPRWTGR